MGSSARSQLAITVSWIKSLCLAAFLGAAIGLPAQSDLSPEERHAFNQGFFKAQAMKSKGDLEAALSQFESLLEIDDQNAVVHYELGQLYVEQDQLDQAIYHSEKAASLDPDNRWYLFLLGGIYQVYGVPEKQLSVFQRLVSLDPEDHEYRFQLAKGLIRNEEYEAALAHLDTLEAQMGVNEALSDLKKTIFLDTENLEGAVAEVKKLIKAYPETLEYYGTLGQLYAVNGYPEKAFSVYQDMLAIDSLDPRPHLDLANYYRSKQDYRQSLHHLKKALKSERLAIDKKIPVLISIFQASSEDSSLRKEAYSVMDYLLEKGEEDPRLLAMYGDYLSRDGKDQKALDFYKRALEKEGGQQFQIWEQVLLIEIQNDLYEALREDAPEAVASFPNQPMPYFMAGVAYAEDEQWQEALFYLESGVDFAVGNPALKEQFLTQLADIHHRLENHRESDQYFERALAINPRNATTLNNYAYYLAQRQTKLDKALEMTRRSNTISPNNPTFLDTWAWVLFQKGQAQQAAEIMQDVFELDPTVGSEVHEHYADILKALGHKDKAIHHYTRALDGSAEPEAIKQKIKELQ